MAPITHPAALRWARVLDTALSRPYACASVPSARSPPRRPSPASATPQAPHARPLVELLHSRRLKLLHALLDGGSQAATTKLLHHGGLRLLLAAAITPPPLAGGASHEASRLEQALLACEAGLAAGCDGCGPPRKAARGRRGGCCAWEAELGPELDAGEKLLLLCAQGFEEEVSREALELSGGDVGRAAEWLEALEAALGRRDTHDADASLTGPRHALQAALDEGHPAPLPSEVQAHISPDLPRSPQISPDLPRSPPIFLPSEVQAAELASMGFSTEDLRPAPRRVRRRPPPHRCSRE